MEALGKDFCSQLFRGGGLEQLDHFTNITDAGISDQERLNTGVHTLGHLVENAGKQQLPLEHGAAHDGIKQPVQSIGAFEVQGESK